MITGYNTDVEYNGITYHVQTEDKGLQTPLILTLLYSGGAILASKRTPYDDLVASGFNEEVLRKRLERQHKLICAAVHAGRIEDLKRMGEREASAFAGDSRLPKVSHEDETRALQDSLNLAGDEGFTVKLLDNPELRSGASVTLRLIVVRVVEGRLDRIQGARVRLRTLGTTFSPTSVSGTTDEQGIAAIPIALPAFASGRAAILVTAEAGGESAELRRIILPAKS